MIVGLDDNTEIWPPLLNLPKDRLVLLLKHHPQIPRYGGQIWLCNLAMKRAYNINITQGMSKHRDSYVSNGAGFGVLPCACWRLLPPKHTAAANATHIMGELV
ncbi:MAG: hypothetical protein LBS53_07105 [Synergistaceae bacterium]|nr:hypothetical protein [Synergistaceae bacterium]